MDFFIIEEEDNFIIVINKKINDSIKPEQEPIIKEPEFKEPEFKEPIIKEPEFKESDFKEPEFKEPEFKEPEFILQEQEEKLTKELFDVCEILFSLLCYSTLINISLAICCYKLE